MHHIHISPGCIMYKFCVEAYFRPLFRENGQNQKKINLLLNTQVCSIGHFWSKVTVWYKDQENTRKFRQSHIFFEK